MRVMNKFKKTTGCSLKCLKCDRSFDALSKYNLPALCAGRPTKNSRRIVRQ